MNPSHDTARTAELVELFAFNRWATERLLDAAATLDAGAFVRDLGSSFPSVRDTLVHIMSAEWVWLSRISGTSPSAMPPEWRECDLVALRHHWGAVHAAYDGFLAQVGAASLEAPIRYRNLAGQAFTSSLGQILRHVVNHSTYHRGQVVTMLRQLGTTAPATDLIAYYRLTGPVPPAG